MPQHAANTVVLDLNLQHRHGLGELGPYFRGLLAGRAIASRCRTCGKAWFPPRRRCPDHPGTLEWTELPGSGRVVAVTDTTGSLPFGSEPSSRTFALVALDGAENLAFGRLGGQAASPAPGAAVWLSRAPGPWPHPAQAACFVLTEKERVLEPLA